MVGSGTSTNRNLAVRAHRELVIVAQTTEAASNAEWDEYVTVLGAAKRAYPTRVCSLALTDGGGLDSTQRQMLTSRVDVKEMPVSLLSSAASMRFLVSMFALVNRKIRTFAPGEFALAIQHMGLAPDREAEALRLMSELRTQLGTCRVIDQILDKQRR